MSTKFLLRYKTIVSKFKRANVIFLWKNQIPEHIIDKDGRKPDPERAAAIKDMAAPDNIASLQSFLVLANY